MKHIFIINPFAGTKDSDKVITEYLETRKDLDNTVHITKAPKEAISFVREYCKDHSDEKLRFYACGGDGTLHEVMNGMFGYENASLAVYPCGSGNDYVKYYGGKERFLDLGKLIDADEVPIDIISVNDICYAINEVDVGLSTVVCQKMLNFKRKPFITPKAAYILGTGAALFTGMKTKCTVYLGGEELNPNGEIILATFSNGTNVGSTFRCAPRSKNDDGLMECCVFRAVNLFTFATLAGGFMKGTHLDDKRYYKYMQYRQADEILIKAPSPIDLGMDGESLKDTEFRIKNLKGAVRFALPKR